MPGCANRLFGLGRQYSQAGPSKRLSVSPSRAPSYSPPSGCWGGSGGGCVDDLDALEEITIRTRGRTFVIRSETQGDAGKAIQAAGVALGSIVRLEDPSHEL